MKVIEIARIYQDATHSDWRVTLAISKAERLALQNGFTGVLVTCREDRATFFISGEKEFSEVLESVQALQNKLQKIERAARHIAALLQIAQELET